MNNHQSFENSPKTLWKNSNLKKKRKKNYNCCPASDSCWLWSPDHLLLRYEDHSLAGGIFACRCASSAPIMSLHLHTIQLSNRNLLQKLCKYGKKRMLENMEKRVFFCLEKPVVFKPCADGHGINSWRALCCLHCAD